MGNRLVEEAVLGIARDDSGPFGATSYQAFARGQVEFRNTRLGVMATETLLLENRLYVLGEVRWVSRVRLLCGQRTCRKKQRSCDDKNDETARQRLGVSFWHIPIADQNLVCFYLEYCTALQVSPSEQCPSLPLHPTAHSFHGRLSKGATG